MKAKQHNHDVKYTLHYFGLTAVDIFFEDDIYIDTYRAQASIKCKEEWPSMEQWIHGLIRQYKRCKR